MKTCPRCGHENTDSVRFCVECQHRFGKPAPSTRPAQTPGAATPETSDGRPIAPPQPELPSPAPAAAKSARPARSATTFRRVDSFEESGAGAANQEAAGRKIVGVLITYTWKPEGQLFVLREGRNLIGRDPDQCEIAITEDSALSSRNTIISYRASFRIADDDSMSGTYVDGEALELRESRPLQNYSTIRTGSTDWLFIAVEPEGIGV